MSEKKKKKSSGMGALDKKAGKVKTARLLSGHLLNTRICDGKKRSLWKKASEREKG